MKIQGWLVLSTGGHMWTLVSLLIVLYVLWRRFPNLIFSTTLVHHINSILHALLIIITLYRLPFTIRKVYSIETYSPYVLKCILRDEALIIKSHILLFVNLAIIIISIYGVPSTIYRVVVFYSLCLYRGIRIFSHFISKLFLKKIVKSTLQPLKNHFATSDSIHENSSNFNSLPDDILVEIFLNLSGQDLAKSVEPVSSKWRSIIHDGARASFIWKKVLYLHKKANNQEASSEATSTLPTSTTWGRRIKYQRNQHMFQFLLYPLTSNPAKYHYVEHIVKTMPQKKFTNFTQSYEIDYRNGFMYLIEDEAFNINLDSVVFSLGMSAWFGALSLVCFLYAILVAPVKLLGKVASAIAGISKILGILGIISTPYILFGILKVLRDVFIVTSFQSFYCSSRNLYQSSVEYMCKYKSCNT